MKKLLLSICAIISFALLSCGGGNNDSTEKEYTPFGELVDHVFLWTIDSSGAEQGSAIFGLYENNGNYYVKFLGEYCRLSYYPVEVDGVRLNYKIETKDGYTYFLNIDE